MKGANNLGKVTRFHGRSEIGVLDLNPPPDRRRTDQPKEYPGEVSFLAIYIVIIAAAVIAAVFGDSLKDQW